jgi:hypothetical protein
VARVGELEEASFLRQLLERCAYKAQAEAGRQGLEWKALGGGGSPEGGGAGAGLE